MTEYYYIRDLGESGDFGAEYIYIYISSGVPGLNVSLWLDTRSFLSMLGSEIKPPGWRSWQGWLGLMLGLRPVLAGRLRLGGGWDQISSSSKGRTWLGWGSDQVSLSSGGRTWRTWRFWSLAGPWQSTGEFCCSIEKTQTTISHNNRN